MIKVFQGPFNVVFHCQRSKLTFKLSICELVAQCALALLKFSVGLFYSTFYVCIGNLQNLFRSRKILGVHIISRFFITHFTASVDFCVLRY